MNLDQLPIYEQLVSQSKMPLSLEKTLTPEKVTASVIHNGPISLMYGTSLADDTVLTLLQQLAREQDVISKYKQLLAGTKVNHHNTRSPNRGFYGTQQETISTFSTHIHKEPITDVVQVGIGGSELGPKAVYHGLKRLIKPKITPHFIANIDPDDANDILSRIPEKTTLFIVVSKSGTTQETLSNVSLIKAYLENKGLTNENIKNQFILVTANKSLPNNIPARETFYIDEAIGGRYSTTSAVGGVLLSLVFGPEVFEELLDGASQIDKASENPNIFENMALMSALIGIWERNFLSMGARAIIPYSQGLSYFTHHLQQLICESNGKRVNIQNEKVSYQTSPIVLGDVGTNAQHSFFQLFHQGTEPVPIQFIAFSEPQTHSNNSENNHDILLTHLASQMLALATGNSDSSPAKSCPGNRPVSLIFGKKLTPKTMGALLSFYENMVMFQSFIWNINAFDQEGVALGKSYASSYMFDSSPPNPIMKRILTLFETGKDA
ncbi:MAG: glucose-6-phosphate isomerase [Candidatus Margulisbacteria bacterium]|nr:glucose-6-phosphate isomerase [Candidatus Margulisiibacteriota bacterium]